MSKIIDLLMDRAETEPRKTMRLPPEEWRLLLTEMGKARLMLSRDDRDMLRLQHRTGTYDVVCSREGDWA
jgi:hypothetical protein